MQTLVFDTETTGLTKHPNARDEVQPKMIEFGAMLVDERGATLDSSVALFNPGEPLEAIITKITGITDDDLKDKPTFAEGAEAIRPMFERADRLVAHNLPFDSTILGLELARAGIVDWPWPLRMVCTVQETAENWGKRPKLTELYEYLTGEPLAQTHRALDDVEALVTVCYRLGIL